MKPQINRLKQCFICLQCSWMLPLASAGWQKAQLAIFWDILFVASNRLFPNALDCQHDDLWPTGHPITAVVCQQMRASCLQVWAEEIDLLFSKCILENTSVHESCIRRVRAKSFWWVDIAVQNCQSLRFSNWEKKKIIRRAYLRWYGSQGEVLVQSKRVYEVSLHVAKDVWFYCDGCGAVLSGLVSWAAGGLLLQGALLPKAGELLKSSSSSRPLVASYWVFSKRVIRRSSSSPNSPPIRVGSPTTITSWEGTDRKSSFTAWTLAANTGSNPVFRITAEVNHKSLAYLFIYLFLEYFCRDEFYVLKDVKYKVQTLMMCPKSLICLFKCNLFHSCLCLLNLILCQKCLDIFKCLNTKTVPDTPKQLITVVPLRQFQIYILKC